MKGLPTPAPLEVESTQAAARAPVGCGGDNTQGVSRRAQLGTGRQQWALPARLGALLAGQPSQ